ncbi:radical SAM protein [Archaeoglobales archaeon]|nr:MAG: radical SAM protein [Archaeoglobales archaeon]
MIDVYTNYNGLKKFIEKIKIPSHCIFCEGIDLTIKEPKHHPSYEITTACNLNCIFCYSNVALKNKTAPKPGYYGSLNPTAITISQYGEPLLIGCEKLAYIIERLKERFGDVRIDLQTNGIFLEMDRLDGLVDIVMVSLDGFGENYVKLTGVNAFDKVVGVLNDVANADCVGVVRSIHMPGINDDDLVKIAKMCDEIGIDEFFLQPISIYKENKEKLLKAGLKVNRAESLIEFFKTAMEIQNNADVNVKVPGCILVNFRQLMQKYEFEDLMFLNRNSIATASPTIRREWRFVIEL